MIKPERFEDPEELFDLAADLIEAIDTYNSLVNNPENFTEELIKEFEHLYSNCKEFVFKYDYYSKNLPKTAPFFED